MKYLKYVILIFVAFEGLFSQTLTRERVSADYLSIIKSNTFKFSTDTTAPAAGYFKIAAKDSSTIYLITSSGNKLNLKTAATGGDITSVIAGFGLTGGATDGAATLVVDSTVMATLYDLTLKANLASPTFTGTVTMPLTAGTVRSSAGGVLSVTASDTVGLGASLAALAPKANPTFTGTVTTPLGEGTVRSSSGGVLSSTASDTIGLAAALAAKAPIASPTFTGTVTVSGLSSGKVKSTSGALSVYSAGTDTSDYVRNIPATDSARIAGTLPSNTVTAAMIQSDAVTSAKVLDGTLVASDLNSDAVTTIKIQDLAVTSGKLSSDAVTSAKILDGTIATADLGEAVTSSKIVDGTIAAADLSSDAVTSGKIQDGAVTTAKIADGTILTADQNANFQAYDSDSTEYARRLAVNLTGYMRGDTLVFTTGYGITSTWKFGSPVFRTTKAVSGGLYIDSVGTNYLRIRSTEGGQPDSSYVETPVTWRP